MAKKLNCGRNLKQKQLRYKGKCPTANELMRIKGSRIKGITGINSVNSDLLKVLHYSIRRMRSSLKVQLQQNLS